MVWYLKGIIEYGLIYARDKRIFLQIYDDLDWVGSGTKINITLTCCRKQTSVSLIPIKDEYIATKNKAKEYSSNDEEYDQE